MSCPIISTDTAVTAAREESGVRAVLPIGCDGCDVFLLSLNSPQRSWFPFLKVVQITREPQTYDQTIRPPSGPYNSNLVVRYADLSFLAHPPALHHFSSFRIPNLCSLIRTTRDKPP